MDPPASTSPSHPYAPTNAYGQPGLNDLSLSVVLDQHTGPHASSLAQESPAASAQGPGVAYSSPDDERTPAMCALAAAEAVDSVQVPSPAKKAMTPPKTLPSVLVRFLRKQEAKAAEESVLCDEVRKCYSSLRKPDGTKYTGNLERAVRGSLCSTGFFEKVGDTRWTLSEENARMYEQRLMDRCAKMEEQRAKKRKERERREGHGDGPRQKRRYIRKAGTGVRMRKGARRELILQMIAGINERLKNNSSWQSCSQNPFRNLKGSETEDDLWKKLGNEKFVFMLQMYNYLADILQQRSLLADVRNGSNSPGVKVHSHTDVKKKRVKSEAVPCATISVESVSSLTNSMSMLQESMIKLNARLANVEAYLAELPSSMQLPG